MTPRGAPLSENGKVLAMCILFPTFWPFVPFLLVWFLCEAIVNGFRDWRWKRRERAALLRTEGHPKGCQCHDCRYWRA